MTKSTKIDFGLPNVDELFSTQEERDDAKLKKIYEIPLNKIDPFPKHPFKVKDDEDMMNLADSIREQGVITPATVTKKKDGRYELLSGHRRKRACELAGLDTLRAEVVEMDKDAATIFMVDSNLQRTTILPSEKAFSYKMRLDAMKRKSGRHPNSPDKPEDYLGNGVPLAHHLQGKKSREILAEQVGESQDNIRRYIRLTYLTPQLLKLVDEGEIALRPAVEISYLPRNMQESIFENINMEQCTPSHAQARKMRTMFENGNLDENVIMSIMQEEKPNQKEKLVLKSDRVRKLFPEDLPLSKREEYVVKAMEYYGRYRERKEKDQER